jgi:hypothetical protein
MGTHQVLLGKSWKNDARLYEKVKNCCWACCEHYIFVKPKRFLFSTMGFELRLRASSNETCLYFLMGLAK